MYTLQLLGQISAADSENRDVDALLRQPKHVALLAYLAMPRPGVWHRRDLVLGTFWSETDQSRARSSLRSALYTLRRHLPEGAVISRGDDELSLDPTLITTDVCAMMEDYALGRMEQVLARYSGELLPGMYVADAPAFDKWLEQERRRLHVLACDAAAQVADAFTVAGNLPAAIAAARRCAELDPDDEAATRRWIALLDKAGDRSGAFAVYEKFRNHMSESFGIRPSAETVALLDAVRTRREPGFVPDTVRMPDAVRIASVTTPAQTETGPAVSVMSKRRSRLPFVGTAIVLSAILLFALVRPRSNAAASAPAKRVVVVLPMLNNTGDSTFDYLASGMAAGVARRLEKIGGLTVRSGARASWSDSILENPGAIAREFGASTLLRTSLVSVADSLEVQVFVVDSTNGQSTEIARRRFVLGGLLDAEAKLTAAVAAGVFRQRLAPVTRDSATVAQSESYRLTLQGQQLLISLGSGSRWYISTYGSLPDAARQMFKHALELNPKNAAAQSGISSTYAIPTLNDNIPFDEGFRLTELSARKALDMDSSQGAALANLAITTALRQNSVAAGEAIMNAAVAADPSNTEIWIIKSALYRHAHRYDEARDAIRVARELDPFTSYLIDREATLEICAGNPSVALELYKSELALNHSDPLANLGMVRTLAMLGRYDDAIVWWTKIAEFDGDTARVQKLRQLRGKTGFMQMVHADGQRKLNTLLERRTTGLERVSDLKVMQAAFASGNATLGFAALEKLESAGTPALYRLTCMPDIDEWRNDSRFKAALERIGALPPQ